MEQVNKPLTEKTSRSSIKQLSVVNVTRLEAAGWALAAQAHVNSLIPFIKKQQVFANAGNPKVP